MDLEDAGLHHCAGRARDKKQLSQQLPFILFTRPFLAIEAISCHLLLWNRDKPKAIPKFVACCWIKSATQQVW